MNQYTRRELKDAIIGALICVVMLVIVLTGLAHL